MKSYHTICFCLATSLAAAQNQNLQDSGHFEVYPRKPIKATIYMLHVNAIRGMITKITDSSVVISISPPSGEADRQFCNIPISEIHKIRVKRNAVVNGMGGGALLGSLAGYGLGYISYDYNESISDADNHEDQKARAALGALIGLIPGSLLGGMVGGVITKRTYTIDGKKENILKLRKVLE